MSTTPQNWIAVGDSLVEPNAPAPRALSTALGVQITAAGWRGASARTWLNDTARAASTIVGVGSQPVILVHLGGNSTAQDADEYRQFDDFLRRFSPYVIWIPPPNWPSSSPIAGRDARIIEALKTANVAVVPVDLRLEPGDFSADKIHLNSTGAARWASQLAPAIRGMLAEGIVKTSASYRLPWWGWTLAIGASVGAVGFFTWAMYRWLR